MAAKRPRTATETAAHHSELVALGMARAERLEPRLAKILEPILANAGAQAAHRFEVLATDHMTAAAAEIASNSTMVAVKPRPDQAAALARDGGTEPDDLHVTICYIGDVQGDLKPITDALARVAASHAPLEGVVGGTGEFAPGEDGAPQIALPDVPGLSELRVAVTQALVDAGIEYAREHGFLPHLTIDYSGNPVDDDAHGVPLNFDDLQIVRGNTEVITLPLTGSRPLTASVVTNWESGPDDRSETTIPAQYHYRPATSPERCADCSYFGAGTVGRCGMFDTPVDMEYVCDEWADGIPAEALVAAIPPWTPPAGDELINVKDLVASLRTKTDPIREAMIRAQMSPALREAGINFDVTNPLTAEAFASTGQHITSIAETTQLNVMRIIRESYDQGLSIPDTATAIETGMKAASFQRATMIARTEMVGAVSAGSLAATKLVEEATGDTYMKVWMTAPGAMYPRHEDYEGLDGQTVRTDQAFEVGAALLQYPGDPSGPPGEVINCRCALSYKSAADVADETSGIDTGGIAGPPMVPPPSDTVSVGAAPFLPPSDIATVDRLGLDAPLDDLEPTSTIGKEIYAKQPDTMHLYKTVGPDGKYDDGEWSTDRKALHQTIIDRFFVDKTADPASQLRAYFTSGGGASGKSASTFNVDGKDVMMVRPKSDTTSPFGTYLAEHTDVIHIDPDMVKQMLPEYDQLRDANDFYAASGVHEESSELAKTITDEAQKRGFSVIVDTTGSSKTFPEKLAEMARKGYEIQVTMFSTPTNEAISRSLTRAAKNGRYVALQALKSAHAGASRELAVWKDLPFVKEWKVWDNTGVEPKLVAEGGGGKPTKIYDEANWERILAKADEGGGGSGLAVPPPIALPKNPLEAAQRFMDGVATNEIYAGKLVDTNAIEKGTANWIKDIQGNIVTDPKTLQTVESADEYNRLSPVFQAALSKNGRDTAIVVKDSTPVTNPISPGSTLEGGARITGNRVTVLTEAAVTSPEVTGLIVPGATGTSSEGGLAATLRHEYGHQIDAALTPSERLAFRDALPGFGTDEIRANIERDLTKYAAFRYAPGNADEAFAELFTIVSDPAYNPADWAPWVRDLGHRFFGAPTEGGVPTVATPLVPAKETVSTLVPGPEADTLSQVEYNRGRVIDQWAEHYDMTPQQFMDALDFQVEDAVADADVEIRVKSSVLDHILDDGRFKSQFETNTSGGSLDPNLRATAEKFMFGYPEDLPVEQRPIYGYLGGSESGGYGVEQYGDAIVHLKPEVRERTTFTLSDSLGAGLDQSIVPPPLTQPDSSAILMSKYRDPYHPHESLEEMAQSYAEAQVHGGVSVNDIQEIVLNKNYLTGEAARAKDDVISYEHWLKVSEEGRDDIVRRMAEEGEAVKSEVPRSGLPKTGLADAERALRGWEHDIAAASEALASAQRRLAKVTGGGPTVEQRLDALGIKYRYR